MLMCPCKVLASRAKTKMKEATLSKNPCGNQGAVCPCREGFDISLIEWPKYNNPYMGFASCRFNHHPCVHFNRPMSDVVLMNFSFTNRVEIFPNPLLLLLLYLLTASLLYNRAYCIPYFLNHFCFWRFLKSCLN